MRSITKQILSGTLLLTALTFTLVLTSCEKKAQPSPEGAWVITSVDDLVITDPAPENKPTLNIDLNENKAWGNLGCNIYNAPVTCTPERGELKLGVMAITNMLCEDMSIQDALDPVLGEIDHYAIKEDGTLELYTGSRLRIRLTKE